MIRQRTLIGAIIALWLLLSACAVISPTPAGPTPTPAYVDISGVRIESWRADIEESVPITKNMWLVCDDCTEVPAYNNPADRDVLRSYEPGTQLQVLGFVKYYGSTYWEINVGFGDQAFIPGEYITSTRPDS